jgi:hypothetical protein
MRLIRNIDPEGDIPVHAVALLDYNGEKVVTGFVSGTPFIEIRSWNSYDLLIPTDAGLQDSAALVWHLGEVDEDDYQNYVALIGTPQERYGFARYINGAGTGDAICELADVIWDTEVGQ